MPLRLPRLAQAVAVIGMASAPLASFAVPAHADTWRQSEWWLTKLHVIQAWRSGEGAGVTVAVLADGVYARQADVSGRIITGPDFTGSKRVPGGPHYGVIGTGLASLIAGHGHGSNSTQGIYGVAADARILSLRVTLSPDDPLWSQTALTSRLPDDIAAGIRYAVKHHASVIVLPADPGMPGIAHWGGVTTAAGGNAAERAAIAYAIKHDVVLVAPAGDNGQAGDAPNFPAAYRGVVAVGAFDRNLVKAPYSSHQRYVMLTAAGRGVAAAAPAGYQTMNSTWAASAIVAGVASLLRSQFPGLTAAQVLKAMTHGTAYQRPGGLRTGSGYGTVDAAKAISEAAAMSPPRARPAAAGALPRRIPVMPAVPSNATVIVRDLLTDLIIGVGLLACLLVPITWYGSIIKRRDRRVALAAADRAQHSRLARGQRGFGADPMLGYFGPEEIPAAAGSQRSLSGSRYQPRPSLSGRSTLTPAFAPRPMLAAPHATADQTNAFAGASGPADPWGASSWSDPGAGADAWSVSPVAPGVAGLPGTPAAGGRPGADGGVPAHEPTRQARGRATRARCGTSRSSARRRGSPRGSRPPNCRGQSCPDRRRGRPGERSARDRGRRRRSRSGTHGQARVQRLRSRCSTLLQRERGRRRAGFGTGPGAGPGPAYRL